MILKFILYYIFTSGVTIFIIVFIDKLYIIIKKYINENKRNK